MAKRLKLRIFRLIPSFQFCRSKDPSALPPDPQSIFFRLSPTTTTTTTTKIDIPANIPDPPPPNYKPYHSFSSAFISRSGKQQVTSSDDNHESADYKWNQDDKWHVIARVQNDSPQPRRKIYNSSISSVTDDREETETLVSSSRSITTDDCSSDFNLHRSRLKKKKKKKYQSRRVRRVKRKGAEKRTETPARLSVFQRLIQCTIDEKVRESFAIIKRSEDPYEDFKRSMLEMIVEKQMFNARDLEQLLHCFLSLNSPQHHETIVAAFSEIWEILFCKSTETSSQS
ncbi:hypothetical protein NE237_024172 [Protea cynaroides]|uniref:Transcription repressor n=1 Tax=Protea cynaroides TaxID=273540 RepID=A0A9Q0K6Y0_9MAGN|nr:hypothetical protein NE237_024172 [Protea cynaroides]